MDYLSLILLLFLPFNVEVLLNDASMKGNMGLHGVYLEIYKTRNILYFSTLCMFISWFNKYVFAGTLVFIISLYVFLKSVRRWKTILLNNIIWND